MLTEWDLTDQGDLADVTELVVSELVTNAYQTTVHHHLDTPIRFRLAASYERVLIEVWDGDAMALRARATKLPPGDATGGRGLLLVDTLSTRWSWYALQHWSGKVVWAEVAA